MVSTPKNLNLYELETAFQVQRHIDADKIQQLEDNVEILIEQIESLKLELDYKHQKLEEIKQELVDTNHELCVVLNQQSVT